MPIHFLVVLLEHLSQQDGKRPPEPKRDVGVKGSKWRGKGIRGARRRGTGNPEGV